MTAAGPDVREIIAREITEHFPEMADNGWLGAYGVADAVLSALQAQGWVVALVADVQSALDCCARSTACGATLRDLLRASPSPDPARQGESND